MLPLGVDIGAARVRVCAVAMRGTEPYVHNVVVRDLPRGTSSSGTIEAPHEVGEILRDAVAETGVRERRCVATLCDDVAWIRPVTFPRMSHYERAKAAGFEASRYSGYPRDACSVRLVPRERAGDYYLGIARTDALRSRVKTLRLGGLRPVAIDHEAPAWRRAAAGFDCVVDVGLARTTVIVFSEPVAEVRTFAGGGDSITLGIARSFGIDAAEAERRKQIVGVAGAAETELDALVGAVADALLQVRSAGREIRRIALSGNGSRIAGLPGAVAAATAIDTMTAPFPANVRSGYAPDVLQAGAADWLFAYGIALWSRT